MFFETPVLSSSKMSTMELVFTSAGLCVCVAVSVRCCIKVQLYYLGGMSGYSSHSKSFSLHSIFATWTESWSSFSLSDRRRWAWGSSVWWMSAPAKCKQGEPSITINITEFKVLDTNKRKRISGKLQQQMSSIYVLQLISPSSCACV